MDSEIHIAHIREEDGAIQTVKVILKMRLAAEIEPYMKDESHIKYVSRNVLL